MIKKHVKKLLRRVSPAFDRRVRRFEKAYEEYADKKVRLRTDEELELQGRGLREIRDILNKLEIPYYVTHGTLLGAIRERDFIRWDWDVGISLMIEDVFPKQDQLVSALKEAGFTVKQHSLSKVNFRIEALKYGTGYELVGFIKIGSKRYRAGYRYPNAFFRGSNEITLRGEKYHTVQDPKEYLVWMYGNWETPVRTCDKTVYIASKVRPSPFVRWILKFF